MNNYIRKILPLCFLLVTLSASAQDKFWVTFKDKDTLNYNYKEHLSPRAIQNRKNLGIPLTQVSDIPVNKAYTDSISKLGVEMITRSKWLNSVSAELTKEQIEQLSKISFVKSIEAVDGDIVINSVNTDLDTKDYSLTLQQMNATAFIDEGLSGNGVVVGVIDAGFYTADRDPTLIHLFDEKKIFAQRDFIDTSRVDLIEEPATNADTHGKSVLDYLCGYYISEKIQTGLGVNAQFYLARTENGDREHRGEEDHWIQAMEWMDSLGVRLVNTSLGYSVNMDDPDENYTKEEMDGKTARITRAAQIAVEEKGIFLVVSAGNSGATDWRIVSAPADAEGVLSVGATDAENPTKIFYSSVGPEFLPYMKPNVSAYSPNGTSFSAPAVTGFVSCIMEKDSTLSNKEIKDIIERSAHLYPYGNNFIGYGIPQADRALKLIEDSAATFKGTYSITTDKDKVELVFDGRKRRGDAVIFHKTDERTVAKQEVVPVKRKRVSLKRKKGETATTVNFEGEVVEVIWKDKE